MLIVIPNTFQKIKIQLLSCYRVTWLSGLSTEEAYLLNQDWFFEAMFSSSSSTIYLTRLFRQNIFMKQI